MLVWEGPSVLDGTPIIVAATADSGNVKTGDMVQLWILARDVAPQVAQRTGEDRAVCGDCPQRPIAGGACYVITFQGPLSVWKSYHRGTLQTAGAARVAAAIRAGKPIRFGAYGDPAAVPFDVWERVLRVARMNGGRRWTGYTHQWRRPDAAPLRDIVMASCDDAGDAKLAQAAGWRTFTIMRDGEVLARDIECLNETSGRQCAACGVCNGARPREVQPPSVWIAVHGARAPHAVRRSPMLRVL